MPCVMAHPITPTLDMRRQEDQGYKAIPELETSQGLYETLSQKTIKELQL